MYSRGELLYAHERVILVFISRVAQFGNKHQKNNPRVSAETVRHESTYIIVLLTRHNESIHDDRTRIFTHRPRVSLARCTFCWWRHNRLVMTSKWPDNCDANTWQVISNSLDIDFIHGDIHDQSCKKMWPTQSLGDFKGRNVWTFFDAARCTAWRCFIFHSNWTLFSITWGKWKDGKLLIRVYFKAVIQHLPPSRCECKRVHGFKTRILLNHLVSPSLRRWQCCYLRADSLFR